MNNWEEDTNTWNESFKNLNVYSGEVPPEIFNWTKDVVYKTKQAKNLQGDKLVYKPPLDLIGHLSEEYTIDSNTPNFRAYELYLESCALSSTFDKYWNDNITLSDNRNLKIASSWINFQKKYDFNPLHVHSGLMSWVIFIKIPYNLNDELKVYNPFDSLSKDNENLNKRLTSKFCFMFPTHQRGGIGSIVLNVDKSYEGKMILFPADLNHTVYPFYTSDDYRITISGNLIFDVTN